MFDEIFIKEMSPIDAYKYGRQTMEKELNEIHLCECNKIRADAIEEFAHALKETFNNEFPSNYHCTQPYFTLDNVRVLIDLVAKEQK